MTKHDPNCPQAPVNVALYGSYERCKCGYAERLKRQTSVSQDDPFETGQRVTVPTPAGDLHGEIVGVWQWAVMFDGASGPVPISEYQLHHETVDAATYPSCDECGHAKHDGFLRVSCSGGCQGCMAPWSTTQVHVRGALPVEPVPVEWTNIAVPQSEDSKVKDSDIRSALRAVEPGDLVEWWLTAWGTCHEPRQTRAFVSREHLWISDKVAVRSMVKRWLVADESMFEIFRIINDDTSAVHNESDAS